MLHGHQSGVSLASIACITDWCRVAEVKNTKKPKADKISILVEYATLGMHKDSN